MVGLIIKQLSNDYTVETSNGLYICKPRGKFRKLGITPKVGDYVEIDIENNYILDIKERKNELDRPSISNIDQAVIVTSVHIPNFSSNLLDKLLTIIEFNNITPIICFTKMDLLNEKEKEEIINIQKYYKKIGYQVYNNTDSNLNLEIGEVSYALGRGRHTTRHTELIDVLGGKIADTPGFSLVDFKDMTNSDIRDNFIEFNEYKEFCEYKDCMHVNERKCAIKDNVEENNILKSRYDNYLKFIEKR